MRFSQKPVAWAGGAADMSGRSRSVRAAYTEMVLALVDARYDPVTEQFDAEVASAVADGQLEEQLARTLRWWQRESVRGVRDHVAEVLPPLLEALDAAALRLTAPSRPSNQVRSGP